MNTAANKTRLLGSELTMQMASQPGQIVGLNNTFVVNYGDETPSATNVPTRTFDAPQVIECWQGMFEGSHEQNSDWVFYHNDQYLIAAVPHQGLADLPIDKATELAYTQIFKHIEAMGYPYLLRTWNYIPHITKVTTNGQNNYQLFCSGRTRAYDNSSHKHDYPAATVAGTQQEGVYIYFIASKTLGKGVENPQQISAFHYPIEYSEDPPLFSRALLHRNDVQEILFVSGTASITGHSTLHEGDVIRQLDVCLDNIRHLIDTAVSSQQMNKLDVADMTQLKVYVKHASDFNAVQTYLDNVLGLNAATCYIQGDLCRDNLLVEIEALAIQAIN